MIYKTNETTYEVAELGDIKPNLIIGGSNPYKFVPNVNKSFDLQGTNNQELYWININRHTVNVISEKEIFSSEDDEIKLTVDGVTDIIGINGKMWDWSVEFLSKPGSNILEWTITHSDGIRFFYQDTLENEWKNNNEGFDKLEDYLKIFSRPNDVVGSYAVYCDRVGIKEVNGVVVHRAKTGKLTHVYRPIAVDALSQWAWCELHITEAESNRRTMTITIPQEFLDTAKYPVKV